tara:strand:+ start:431 stop:616 length:186 start_codon:yes stop_codon:yes gene_type:complete
MIKKLYQKDGFILIDNSKSHHVRGIDKNFFIIKKISEKNGDIKKEDAIREYYESKGFNYTL